MTFYYLLFIPEMSLDNISACVAKGVTDHTNFALLWNIHFHLHYITRSTSVDKIGRFQLIKKNYPYLKLECSLSWKILQGFIVK